MTQLGSRRKIDVAVVDYLTNVLHPIVRQRDPGVKTYALHDLSMMADFEFEARTRMLRWCVQHRNEFSDTGIAHPPLTSMWTMVINVAKVTLDSGGFPFRIYPSIDLGIAALGLRCRGL